MKKKLIALLSATTFLLTGCGTATVEDKKQETSESITVMSRLMDNENRVLEKMATEWSEESGVKVNFIEDEGDTESFKSLLASENGPDVVIGMSHDNLGAFYENGLIQEVPSGLFDESDYSSTTVWDAGSYNGKRYAVPFAMETYSMLYNKDMVDTVPKTMEELIEGAKKNSSNKLVFDIGNFYYSGAFINAFGGYVFGGENGKLDANDIGLNNEGAIKGYKFLGSLVNEHRIMANKMNWNDCTDAMKNKSAAYYISGPWDVSALKEAGINVGIAKIPQVDGNEVKTFLGVQTSIVSANSKNSEKAWEFVKYLETDITKVLVQEGNRIPVLNSILNEDFVANNEIMQGFIAQTKNAVPMPNLTEMSAIWNHYQNLSEIIVSDNIESDVNATVEKIKSDINK